MEALAVVHLVLSVLGALASAAGYVVPWFTTMVDIQRDGLGDRSSVPYVAALINCLLWIMYGVSPSGGPMITLINIVGASLMLCYLLTVLKHCQADDFERLLVFPAVGFVGLLCMSFYFFPDMHGHLPFLAWVCALWRSLVAILPLQNLIVVYRQRNMRSMPSFLVCAIWFVTAIIWAAYAWTGEQFDGFVFFPSLVGFLSAGLQLILHFRLTDRGGLVEPLL